MKAMRFVSPGAPLVLTEVSLPSPRGHELLIRVQACGVCRTDLHLLDGELPAIPFPVTPGHEIVGTVAALGPEASEFRIGDRVGVPRLISSLRWRVRRASGCSPSRVPEIPPASASLASSARSGPAAPTSAPASGSMPRSCSRRWALWYPRPSGACAPADAWCVPASI